MMGQHNPDLRKGLDSVFDCLHFDWYPYQNNPNQLQIDLLQIVKNFNPDIIFMHTQCDIITKETLKKIKNAS